MSGLLLTFLNNLAPIILIALTGFLAGKWLQLNPRTLSQVIFYVFSPCLVFNLLMHSELDNEEILRMVGFAGVMLGLIGLLAWGMGRLLRLEGRLLAAVLLAALFMNAGNYGLPLTDFAFGKEALAYASLFFVCSAMFTNTVGILIASSGKAGLLASLKGLLRLPATYALVSGLLFNRLGWTLPAPLERSVTLLAEATIPAMLVLLGMQFVHIRLDGHLPALALAGVLRLVVAPLLALGVSRLLSLEGAAYQAAVLESAMPTAVLTTVLATEFDTQPSFVTTAVFVTTLLSPLTLTPLLVFLGA